MNILITGASGFIAHNLIKKIDKKHNIFCLCNGRNYKFNNDKITVNLLNKEHVDLFLQEKIKIDVLVHTAAKLANTDSVKNTSLFFDNAEMYKNLIVIINKLKPNKVINLSSIAVYPNRDGEYYEDSEIRPSVNNEGLYGLAKFCGENLLDLCCKGIGVSHLRVAQVFSKREDRIFKVMEKELKELNTITVYGDCRRVSNFITIDMLIRSILFFIKNDMYGIFNIGDKNLSYKDLALSIIEKHGNSQSTIKCVDKGVSSRAFINVNKLKKLEI